MLHETIQYKFTDHHLVTGWQILTDDGWQDALDVKKTIPYEEWHVKLSDGKELTCADTHIVFDRKMREKFVKDLMIGDLIHTEDGMSSVIDIMPTGKESQMYDIGVNSSTRRYYTNGILSHNTTCAAGYLLWYAMFNDDVTILVAAHKAAGASEIMERIRYAYESCPDHVRCGIVEYNKSSIKFDNKSRIMSTTTTETTGRGLTINLLYCLDGDSTVRIRDKETLIEEQIELRELYKRLYKPENVM
jgi:hypothetical protein